MKNPKRSTHRISHKKSATKRAGTGTTSPIKRSLGLLIVIIILGLAVSVASNRNSNGPTAIINGQKFSLEIANTPATLQQGLSDRDTLGSNKGMLFIFDKLDAGCFWMKGMRFNLDIIWLDNLNKVIYMQQDLSPATYPKSYCPGAPSHYVLELNAGAAKTVNLQIGNYIKLENL